GQVSLAPAAEAEKSSEDNRLLRRFQITKSGADIAKEIDALAVQYSQKVKMPGFRQGKVPVDVVKKVHKQALEEEVIQQAVSKLAFARIEQDKIAIASEPYVEKMDHGEGKDLVADIAVEVLPEVQLPGLETLKVEIPKAVIRGEPFDEAKQVALVLEANKRSQAVKDRPVQDEDLALLLVQSADAAGKRKWPRQETYFLMKKDGPEEISGLYGELLGKKAGEKFSIQRSYPADAVKKAWSGKTIEHQVEIKSIFELKKPELDENFLKTLGLKSAADFKAKLKEEYEHRQEHRKDEQIMDKIYEKLLASCAFPIPRSLVEQEAARLLSRSQRPLNFKNDEEKNKLKEQLFVQAEQAVRLSLILEQVRKQYKVDVSAEDIEKEYAHLAKHNSLPEKEIRKYYQDHKKLDELKDHLLNVKLNEFIKEKIKIKEV
ncbi:MAG: trigger factor, partial [Candidatus Aminicenantes bacterium]|nr:trigger factor [Candidatus Aminicenantes bacterium]